MTSLFDHAGLRRGLNDPPLELVSDLVTAGRRRVSLLEFLAVDEEPEPVAPAAVDEVARDEAEAARVEAERAHQLAAMIDAARDEATREERKANAQRLEAAMAEQRARMDRMSSEFARDRARYFAAAEGQVVKLALAIARRVLAREVMADPLHLAASVRLALAKLQDGSTTTLRVSTSDLAAWHELLAPDAAGTLSLVEDRSLPGGQCSLETAVGRIELSVPVQLQEIERSFRELNRHGAEDDEGTAQR